MSPSSTRAFILGLSVLVACDEGESTGTGTGATDSGPTDSATASGSTDAVDGTQTGGEPECMPEPAECSDPDQGDDPICTASADATTAISHGWSIDSQGGNAGLCTPQAGDLLVFDCVHDGGSTFALTVELSVPEPLTLPWDETDEVRVGAFSEINVNGQDSVVTVRDPENDALLLVAIHLDWTDPPGHGDLPFSVEARRDVCCAARPNIALTFEADGGAPLTLYSDTQGEFSGSTGDFTAYVGDAWFNPCPEPVTGQSNHTFDYVVIRNPE